MKSGYQKFFSDAKNARAQNRPVTRRPNKSKSYLPPLQLLFSLVVGFGLVGSGWYYQDQVINFLESIEVSALSFAEAEEKAAPAPEAQAVEAAKDHEKSKEADHSDDPAYLKKLVERKKELDARELEITKTEEELRLQRETLDAKIKELDQIRAQIGEVLREKVEVDSGRVDKLVEFYSNMKPQQAAKIMESLNEDLAVETLGRMKKKNAADIMNLLEAKKAQSISEKFAGYRRK